MQRRRCGAPWLRKMPIYADADVCRCLPLYFAARAAYADVSDASRYAMLMFRLTCLRYAMPRPVTSFDVDVWFTQALLRHAPLPAAMPPAARYALFKTLFFFFEPCAALSPDVC